MPHFLRQEIVLNVPLAGFEKIALSIGNAEGVQFCLGSAEFPNQAPNTFWR
jgi:hypothetical protein